MAKNEIEPMKVMSEKDIQKRIDEAVAEALKMTPKSTGMSEETLVSIMSKVLPAAIMAMEQAKTLSVHEATLKALKAKAALEEKCHICRQVVGDGKGRGCGGPWARNKDGSFVMVKDETTGDEKRVENPDQFHIKMVIFPNDPLAEQQFDGVQINGAYYRSQGPNHKVWVPKKNDIAATLIAFEEDQRVQRIGRKKMRQSGSVSGNGGHNVQGPTFT